MVKRRTRAVVEFGIAMVGLFAQIRVRKAVRNQDGQEDQDPGTDIAPSGLALGILSSILSLWARDNDIGRIRTNRRRSLLFSACRIGIRRRSFPQTETFRSNFGIGQTAGLVVYRLWYGVLRPLPGTDE